MTKSFYSRYVPPAQNSDPQSPVETRVAKLEISEKTKTADRDARPKKPKKRRKLISQETQLDVEKNEEKHKLVLAKFEKSLISTKSSVKDEEQSEEESVEDSELEEDAVKDIVPIPQPEDSPQREFKPSYSATPDWITNPVKAHADHTASFASLGVDEEIAKHLQRKGYEQAFAVQTAVLPLLLRGPRCHRGDLCVSAATGSGKTLAYIIPIVQALKRRPFPRLSAIIVAPTRDLVKQIREVAFQCVARTSLQVGTASGSQTLATEQDLLIKKSRRYDPQGYKELQARADDTYLCGRDGVDEYLRDAIHTLVHHVPHYESKVDILICTPGRLAEHLRSTVGFNLDNVEWFIIDEVDSMIDREFHLWANTAIRQLYDEKPVSRMTARDKLLMTLSKTTKEKLIRKIVLSATMTKDIAKLQLLQLKRPKLVLLENARSAGEDQPNSASDQQLKGDRSQQIEKDPESAISGDRYELPLTLYERAIPVDDDAYKPLYLLWLLQKRILDDKIAEQSIAVSNQSTHQSKIRLEGIEQNASTSSSESDSSGETRNSKDRRSQPQLQSHSSILIFTKSNESAARLAHLLSHLLEPPYSKSICLLDKTPGNRRNRSSQASNVNANFALSAFRGQRHNQSQHPNIPAILIASDRASRGLDLRSIRHVINYDVPRDVRSYVHRAGRTARAGEKGECWTLYGFKEAAWFWREIGRNDNGSIGRGGRGEKVERIKVDAEEILWDEWKGKYEVALEELRRSVMGVETREGNFEKKNNDDD